MVDLSLLETTRLDLQSNLDRLKTQKERNVLGQFATPKLLADCIVNYAAEILDTTDNIRFLDPAVGTGVFFSSIASSPLFNKLEVATGFEIDPHYGKPAQELWKDTVLDIRLGDFTNHSPQTKPERKYNLLICNPPYVRHHHINGAKNKLRNRALEASGVNLSGLSGLYCYFMTLAHSWMAENALLGWLIPSEFMDVNYGSPIKEYLLNKVELLHIHRFDPNEIQFDGALVSSCIVWYRLNKPRPNHKIKFAFGGVLNQPQIMREIDSKPLTVAQKWTRFPQYQTQKREDLPKLGDYFFIKRGIATGANNFFILPRKELELRDLPIDQFRPILPSPRYLRVSEVKADPQNNPVIEPQLFVLNCTLPIERIKESYPNLYAYLETGVRGGISERYLCKKRKNWYFQENRTDSKFYCSYMGRFNNARNNPFRFILNHSKAIVSNSYLILYPKLQLQTRITEMPDVASSIYQALNMISGQTMSEEGRVYGGGMYKLEPKELANVPVTELKQLLHDVEIE